MLSVLLACACASAPGRLEANRFQHERYPYSLFYAPTGNAEYPLGAHYTVENFEWRDKRHRYAKLGPEFTIDRTYRDESPAMVGREPFYDLLLSREQPRAHFWLRSVPLAKAERDTALATLAQQYVDAISQAGRADAPFGLEAPLKLAAPVELRAVQTRACELSKREALRLDFTLQNPAAARSLNEPEWLHASVVIVRTGYFTRVNYPVLLLAGRTSAVANDPAIERDFDRMLELLALGDKGQGLTMKGGTSCTNQPSSGAAGTSPGNTESGAAPAAPGPAPTATSGDQRGPTLEVPIIQDDAAPPAPGSH
jgi:hypothetical protein